MQNKIVVDAMGSDFAPKSEVEGSLLAIQESIANKGINPLATPLFIILVGMSDKIQLLIDDFAIDNKAELLQYLEVVDAQEVITMDDDPVAAIKTKQDSSMVKGLQLHKSGVAGGYVSAGNTGATLTLATIILGRISGVSRPTIGAFLPTSKHKSVFVLDVGATLECKSRFLYEYAVMGSIFCNVINGVANPSIGLLNVGEEPSKGTSELIDAYNKLKNSGLNFYGNVEGNDILTHKTDIVICDGYVGNVVLKLSESIIDFFDGIDIAAISPALKKLLSGFDSEEAGGVPLLGAKGNVIVGHGNSTAMAIKNMIFKAYTLAEKDICKQIEVELGKAQ